MIVTLSLVAAIVGVVTTKVRLIVVLLQRKPPLVLADSDGFIFKL